MKTLSSREPIFSNDSVQLFVPQSWEELTQEQLRYVLSVMTIDWQEDARIWTQTLILKRLAGFRVERMTDKGWLCYTERKKKTFVLSTAAVTQFLTQLDWLFEDGTCSVRLDVCQGRKAVDAELHDVNFFDYLCLENYYQTYIGSPEDNMPLVHMANILYPLPKTEGEEKRREPEPPQMFEAPELYGVFLWYRHIKVLFAEMFPNLFRPASGAADGASQIEMMNAQIRALTDGDITKEKAVFGTEVWRALTELDAKVKEAQELKSKMKQ